MRKHSIDERPVEAVQSRVKSVGYYLFRSKKLDKVLEFGKSGMSRKWHELPIMSVSQNIEMMTMIPGC
jgi:hypothetical protein